MFVNMILRSLFIFAVIGVGAASASLSCDSGTLAAPGQPAVCTKTSVSQPPGGCGGRVTTTVVVSTTVDFGAASAILDCGTTAVPGDQRKEAVGPATLGEVPWHAGIYSKAFTPYKMICEGTLVSASVVISAAHCFWNSSEEALTPASRYAVAVGKLYRPWDAAADAHAQKSDVREISIPARFRGSVTSYQEDIAVVKLATTVQLSSLVRPACLDFDYALDTSQLAPGQYGKIATWSIPESEPVAGQGRTLQVQEFPVVDVAQCFTEAPASFHPFITSDKFCAFGQDSLSVLCRGSAGAGLTFRAHGAAHFLRGVVSSSAVYRDDGCSQFIGFTQIAKHEHFIKQHL